MIKNKDETKTNTNFLPHLDVENDEIIADKIVNNAANNNEEQSEIELSESDLQLQVRKIDANFFIRYFRACTNIKMCVCVYILFHIKF